MITTLAADIGGTNSRFLLTLASGASFSRYFPSQDYDDFEAVLSDFFVQADITSSDVDAACFAVAGPVDGDIARVTNLPWVISAAALTAQFGITKIKLCNDFAAVGYGISQLTDDDVLCLQVGEPDLTAPRAVIGAGTGLGQALLIPQQDRDKTTWEVFPTEGGHTDFAPTDVAQARLWQKLVKKFGHVSYERLVSGAGLVEIYNFLAEVQPALASIELHAAMQRDDAAMVISQFAWERDDALAQQAFDWFIKIYGAQAGNFALSTLPRGGLYIAGGIAAKNKRPFEEGQFLAAMLEKGRMRSVLEKIPVYLVLRGDIGVLGAQYLAGNV